MSVQTVEYDEAYGLLVHLCGRRDLSDVGLLCVMEAFNELADLRTPRRIVDPPAGDPTTHLRRALELLEPIASSSSELAETLQLLAVRRLLTTALGAQR